MAVDEDLSVHSEVYVAGYTRATADIVAWLRNTPETHSRHDDAQSFANAIERGDFRKVEA